MKNIRRVIKNLYSGWFLRSVDSPRLRYAGRPSLLLRKIEGGEKEIINCIFIIIFDFK